MATFGYWNKRAIAQPIRFLLAYLDVKYTEKIYSTTNRSEWFEKDKQTLGIQFPNLPYYIDQDIQITETAAIPVYLIKKHNKPELLGQNPDGSYNEKEVRIQQLLGVLRDIQKEIIPLVFNPQFETVKESVFTQKFQPLLTRLIEYLGNKDFLVGTLSYADFVFYEILNYFKYIYPTTITENLTAYLKRFEELPGVKEYISHPTIDLNVFESGFWTGPK